MSPSFLTPQERLDMEKDTLFTGISSFDRFDIRRRIEEANTDIGGVSMTSTAIQTVEIELQHLRGDETLEFGGLRVEANYRAFCHKDVDIRANDIVTPDSGTTEYRVQFVQDLWPEHIEFFAKKAD